MSEFHDPELRQQLGRMSGPYPDDNVAFAAWQRRVGRARRRRAMASISGAAMSLVMVTVGVAALQNPGRHTLVPGESSETSARVTVSVATTEADDSTTVSTAPETTAPTALATDTTPSTEGALETSVPETETTHASGSGPGSNSDESEPDVSTTPTHAPAPQTATKTVNSVGGSVTVRQNGDQLTVIAINLATGFQIDRNEQPGDQVRVILTSANHQSEISVELSDGAMSARVSEHSDSQGESAPGDSSGRGSGGNG
jgi:hypothetical protein